MLNITPEDMDVVKRGWERVLRARLEDARFFGRPTCAKPLTIGCKSSIRSSLSVVFGSMGDKTRRLEALCCWLVESCAPKLADAGVPVVFPRQIW